MRDADIDLARLQSRRDAAIARYQTRAYLWQGLQAAALAMVGFALAGRVQAVLSPDQAMALAGAAGLALLIAGRLHGAHEADLKEDKEDLKDVDEGMENLKRGGAP